jgi:hypothetical protein
MPIDIDPKTGAPIVTPDVTTPAPFEETPPEATQLPEVPPVEEVPPTEPPPTEEVPDPVTKEQCLKEINGILSEHGGMESNVGVTHPRYWRLIRLYRTLEA